MQITHVNCLDNITFEGGNCHRCKNKYNNKSYKKSNYNKNNHARSNFKYDDVKTKYGLSIAGGLLTGMGLPLFGIPLIYLGFSNKARKSLIGKLRK